MKTCNSRCRFPLVCTLGAVAALINFHAAAQSSWTAGAGDGNWNNALNWDLGVPAEGTNAFIGVNTSTIATPDPAPRSVCASGSIVIVTLATGIVASAILGFFSSIANTRRANDSIPCGNRTRLLLVFDADLSS